MEERKRTPEDWAGPEPEAVPAPEVRGESFVFGQAGGLSSPDGAVPPFSGRTEENGPAASPFSGQAGGFSPAGEGGLSSSREAAGEPLFSEPAGPLSFPEAAAIPAGGEGSLSAEASFRRGMRAYRAAWICLALQGVTVLLTGALVTYLFLRFLSGVDSVVSFYVAGFLLAFVVVTGILLGVILFVAFGICGLIFSTRAVRVGAGGGRAEVIRLITAVLTGLGALFLLLVLILFVFSLLEEASAPAGSVGRIVGWK